MRVWGCDKVVCDIHAASDSENHKMIVVIYICLYIFT